MEQAPTLEISKLIWISDAGYRSINGYLSESTNYKYSPSSNIVEYNGIEYKIEDVVRVLKENMEPDKYDNNTYYRGGTPNSQRTFKKETFISITPDQEQAASFVDGECCLYTITVDPDVKRLHTGVEGEVLIENGAIWEYIGDNNVVIHSPSNPHYLNVEYYNKPTQPSVVNQELDINIKQLLDDMKEEHIVLEIDEPINAETFVQFVKERTGKSISQDDVKVFFGGKKLKRKTKHLKKTHRKTKRSRHVKRHRNNRKTSKRKN